MYLINFVTYGIPCVYVEYIYIYISKSNASRDWRSCDHGMRDMDWGLWGEKATVCTESLDNVSNVCIACSFVHLLFVSVCVCLPVCLSVCLAVSLSVCLTVCLCLSVCLSVFVCSYARMHLRICACVCHLCVRVSPCLVIKHNYVRSSHAFTCCLFLDISLF